jgi:hypothetical protein
VLVTTGASIHNLYRDVFYIPDPTLAFLGLSINTATFSFFEYQSISIARVFSGRARLPSTDRLRADYTTWRVRHGDPRFVHLLGKEGEKEYVAQTVEWLNAEAKVSGAEPVQGHSEEWLRVAGQMMERLAARWGLSVEAIKRAVEGDKEESGPGVPKPITEVAEVLQSEAVGVVA